METTLHWPALVTLATLTLLFGCAWYVGYARGRYKVSAPATTVPAEFERAFRVQMNTLENTVLFLPALWLAAVYFNPRIAAAILTRCGWQRGSGTRSPMRATRSRAAPRS